MKIVGLLLFLFFAFCVSSAAAQTKKPKKIATKTAKAKTAKKIPKTISMGVINSKAIDLIKPEYPKAARAVNVYGQVKVQILVDGNGDVISTKVISGHQFLRFSSEKAALQSKFEPLTFGGEAVRFSGIIFYNFIPSQWNWLEIGFILGNSWSGYYSIKTLLETLPLGYDEERQLLQQSLEASENQAKITETVIVSIRGKLSSEEKAAWLFSVGLALAKTKNEWNINGHSLKTDSRSFQDLAIHAENPPETVKFMLLENLKRFIVLTKEYKIAESFQILRTKWKKIFGFLDDKALYVCCDKF